MKNALLVFMLMLFAVEVHAQATARIYSRPNVGTPNNADEFLIDRSDTTSRNITWANLKLGVAATLTAPGSAGQLIVNSAGVYGAASGFSVLDDSLYLDNKRIVVNAGGGGTEMRLRFNYALDPTSPSFGLAIGQVANPEPSTPDTLNTGACWGFNPAGETRYNRGSRLTYCWESHWVPSLGADPLMEHYLAFASTTGSPVIRGYGFQYNKRSKRIETGQWAADNTYWYAGDGTTGTMYGSIGGNISWNGNITLAADDSSGTLYFTDRGQRIDIYRLYNRNYLQFSGMDNILLAGSAGTGYQTQGVSFGYDPNQYLWISGHVPSGSDDMNIWSVNGSGGGIDFRSGGGSIQINPSLLVGTYDVNAVASAAIEVRSTTKGFLPPRMTTAERDAISSPAEGLVVYNTTTDAHEGYNGTAWHALSNNVILAPVCMAASDEDTELSAAPGVFTFRMPYGMTVSYVRASLKGAPAGSTFVVDINESGSSILSTKLSIDAGEETSTTAATPAVVSDATLADDAEITIDIDQVGSSTGGNGLKVCIVGTQ